VAENIRLGNEEEDALRHEGDSNNNDGFRGRGGRGGGGHGGKKGERFVEWVTTVILFLFL
jgi:hypothetical protein